MTTTYTKTIPGLGQYDERDLVFTSRVAGMPQPDAVLRIEDTLTFSYFDDPTIDDDTLDAWQDALVLRPERPDAPWRVAFAVNEQVDEALALFQQYATAPTPLTRDEMWSVLQAVLGVVIPLLRSLKV